MFNVLKLFNSNTNDEYHKFFKPFNQVQTKLGDL